MSPSRRPTSSVPSALPTITGSVVFVELTKDVTASLTESEIQEIVEAAEEAFGLFPDNVEATVSYSISGTVDVSIDGEYEEEELVQALQESLATSLNVHASDVVVTVDPETGVISYEVTSASAEAATALQSALQTSDINGAILEGVTSVVPGISNVTCWFCDTCSLRLQLIQRSVLMQQ